MSDAVNPLALSDDTLLDLGCPSPAGTDLEDTEMNRTFTTVELIATPATYDSGAAEVVTVTTLLEQDSLEGPTSSESPLNRIPKDMCEGDQAAPLKPSPSLLDVSTTKSELESSVSDEEMTLVFDATTAPVEAAWLDNALNHQGLMFQGQLRKCSQELDSARKEAIKWRSKCEQLTENLLTQDRTLEHIMRENSSLLTAVEVYSKNREIDAAPNDASLQEALKERDELSEDLNNMEIAFADFHRRHERARHAIKILKENEAILNKQVAESQKALKKNHQMIEMLKTKTEEGLEAANKELEDTKKSWEGDIAVLKGQLKKAEMNNTHLEKRLEQKTAENEELTKLCDDLLDQMKAK